MRRQIIAQFIAVFFGLGFACAQQIPSATTAGARKAGYEQRLAISGDHILQNLKFSSAGPTVMGGRVTDIEVSPVNANVFYVAYASGGLWKTENNGQSYKPLFDNEMVMSIGDIAVDWKRNIIWVGTGENNSSRSSYSGYGIYRSNDNGKTWKHMGLPESHRIGRIVLHPDNPDIVWVAVLGHLYSSNAERGVYKTTDGGKTWKKTLYIDEQTGAIDLVCDPKQPNTLYASMWYRDRKAWNFVESGETSGIYKSVDDGENWSKISGQNSGFPEGKGVGRIGLSLFSAETPVLYAVLDNQDRRPPDPKKANDLTVKKLRTISTDQFLALKDKQINDFLKNNTFPKKYTADTLRRLVRKNTIQPASIADFLNDANQQLFDTEVIGAEVYRSGDGGKTWKKTHSGFLNDVVYSYGYYFGQIRVSPTDVNRIFITGVPLLRSDDGGKTFKSINGDNQHVDHHALWVSPLLKGHLINGNDGGINISYDGGKNWLKVKSPPVGQFYSVNVDMNKPYNIYGGLQDNGVWKGPSNYKESERWQYFGRYPYDHLLSGDGFKVEIDSRDNTIYTGYQFGNYYRMDKDGGGAKKIQPRHELGQKPLRFNWQTPIHLSRHNQDVFYIGSNKFHRSLDKGETYDFVSEDLTRGHREGDVAFGTLTCLNESPLRFGMIYAGSDDGLIHRSDDLGYTWKRIVKGLPENLWVTGLQASAHERKRVYAALNGYRWDHFNAYIYVSENAGEDWKRIGTGLPSEPVNVIKEDPVNANLLYVGTDHGLYISIDRGITFMKMGNGIPSVSVHDLVIQPRDNDLVVATHGRSIYKTRVGYLQKLTDSVLLKGIHFFKIASVDYKEDWGKKNNEWKEIKPPKVECVVYVKKGQPYTIAVSTKSGLKLFEAVDTLESGLNYYNYHLNVNPETITEYSKWLEKENKNAPELEKADDGKYYLRPGTYVVEWKHGASGLSAKSNLIIKKNEK